MRDLPFASCVPALWVMTVIHIALMIVGIVVWKKQKTPKLFLAGFLMFLFSGLGAACLELMFYTSMYGEVLMSLLFYLYAKQKAAV